ncbi:MAG: diacylglycerol kinase [Lactobacillales bacterium]|jgi:diacylglycerol kinase (ATP)|nr:diacylglycerol kinase [Lactobacillales bacterium]
MKSPHKGIKRLFNAFLYSKEGFTAAYKSEEAFRLEVILFVIFTVIACFLPVAILTKAFLISSLFLVLLMELTNTAIEVVIDRISAEYHPLSKKAKDIGSLLVLLSLLNAGVVWLAALISIFY